MQFLHYEPALECPFCNQLNERRVVYYKFLGSPLNIEPHEGEQSVAFALRSILEGPSQESNPIYFCKCDNCKMLFELKIQLLPKDKSRPVKEIIDEENLKKSAEKYKWTF